MTAAEIFLFCPCSSVISICHISFPKLPALTVISKDLRFLHRPLYVTPHVHSLFLRRINDLQAVIPRIVYGICGAAVLFRKIADAETAVIDQMPISFLHTAVIILLRRICHFVRGLLNSLILLYIPLIPSPCLIHTRENQYKADLRIGFP